MENVVYTKKCKGCGNTLSYNKGHYPKNCFFCNRAFWDKPGIEYDLFIVQDKFLQDINNSEIWGEYYSLLNRYVPKIVTNVLRLKNLLYDRETKETLNHDVIVEFLETYRRWWPKKFIVSSSFYGYLYKFIPYVLFRVNNDKIKMDSLDAMIDESHSLLETLDRFGGESFWISDYFTETAYSKSFDNFIEGFVNLLNTFYTELTQKGGPTYSLIFLQALYLKLKKGDSVLNDFFSKLPLRHKEVFLFFQESFHEYIKDFYS